MSEVPNAPRQVRSASPHPPHDRHSPHPTPQEQPLYIHVQCFRGGLVFEAFVSLSLRLTDLLGPATRVKKRRRLLAKSEARALIHRMIGTPYTLHPTQRGRERESEREREREREIE